MVKYPTGEKSGDIIPPQPESPAKNPKAEEEGKPEQKETGPIQMTIEEFKDGYFTAEEKATAQGKSYESQGKTYRELTVVMQIVKEGRNDLSGREISIDFGDKSVSRINSLLKEIAEKMGETNLDPRFLVSVNFPGTRRDLDTEGEKQREAIKTLNKRFADYKDGATDIFDFRFYKGWSLRIEKLTEQGEDLEIEDILEDIKDLELKRYRARTADERRGIGEEQEKLQKQALNLIWDRTDRTKVNLKLEFEGAEAKEK